MLIRFVNPQLCLIAISYFEYCCGLNSRNNSTGNTVHCICLYSYLPFAALLFRESFEFMISNLNKQVLYLERRLSRIALEKLSNKLKSNHRKKYWNSFSNLRIPEWPQQLFVTNMVCSIADIDYRVKHTI